MKRFIGLIIIIAIIYFGYKLIVKENSYQGVYYPDGCLICEDRYIFSQVFNSAEDCVNWATNLKNSRGNPSDLWECGKNCKFRDGFNVCEETFDE